MKMICLRPFRYAGKLLAPGEEFEVKEKKNIQILALIKKAKIAEAKEAAEDQEEAKPKRRYRRRDMQAEDA